MASIYDNLVYLGYCGVFVATVPYLLGPVFIRFTQRRAARPVVEVIENEATPEFVEAHFSRSEAALAEMGIVPVGRLFVPGKLRSYLLVMENTSVQGSAVAGVLSSDDDRNPKVEYVTFRNQFTDGTNVFTSNQPDVSILAPMPNRVELDVPEEQNPAAVYAIHVAMVERFGKGKTPKPLDLQDIAANSRKASMEIMEEQVKAGLFYLSGDSLWYKPTWKGACLMTWKLCWPIKHIRVWRAKKKREELLRSLNLAGQSARV